MKTPRYVLSSALTILIFVSCPINAVAQGEENNDRLTNLMFAINRVLQETGTPSAGIALVNQDGPIWIEGLGTANLKDSVDADENTLYRIASISKMFVGLSILKLREEGKLTLQDKIRDVIPEIEFHNEWEKTDPVRIVHLLEHTTGWDDYHLTEQVTSPLTLKEGLDYHPHSRTSRWVPGSRMAYSNSGPGVAAYIVEKITGQRYEDYVADNFFQPLRMGSTTFHNDELYKKYGATLYDRALQPLKYRHVIQRPVGSINSSPADMAKLVRFFLRRGLADTVRLIDTCSIARMEQPMSTPGARAGLKMGYGITNTTSMHNGYVYHGHNGGVPGALSELAYLPDHGIGHAFFINSGNSHCFQQISTLIRDFETQGLGDSSLRTLIPYSGGFKFKTGYYHQINPRIAWGYFMDRLVDIHLFEANEKFVLQSGLLPGKKTLYYPLTDSTFGSEKSDIVMMVKAIDPLAGEVIYNHHQVLKPISSFIVFGQLTIIVSWVILMIAGMFMWLVSAFRFLISGSNKSLRIRNYTTMASVLVIVNTFLMIIWGKHQSEKLIEPGLLSITLMLLSLLFIIYSFWSVVIVFRLRRDVSRFTFLHMGALASLHVLVALYLLWFDVIPIITWA